MKRRNNKSPKWIGYVAKFLPVVLLVLAFTACKTQQKSARYKAIYAEKPGIILVANPIDDSFRKDISNIKTKRLNSAYNNELEMSAKYFQQDIMKTLLKKHYYVIPTLSSQEIWETEKGTDARLFFKDSIRMFQEKYDIDAILFTHILAWKETENDWSVYVDYQLKSTHSNTVLFRSRVKGKKQIIYNRRGYVTMLPFEKGALKKLGISDGLGQRVVLLTKMNEFILSNLPVGKLGKNYEKDLKKSALSDCIEFFIDDLGGVHVENMLLEKFEQECFVF